MKKFIISLLVVLLLSMVIGGVAYASTNPSEPTHQGPVGRGRLKWGEITELGADELTIMTGDGGSYTYLVDENTGFRMKDVKNPTFSDLQVGQFVLVGAKFSEDGLVARVVIIPPEDFNPARFFGIRVRGEVVSIDSDEGLLTLEKQSGEEIVFIVGERTRFGGQASTLDDLAPGWSVEIAGGRKEDGTFFASVVGAVEKRRHIKNVGLIAKLDEDQNEVTLLLRNGEESTFIVDEDTKFHSRENTIENFDDLKLDMVAVVDGLLQEDGSYLVKHLGAADKDDLPDFDIKSGGIVIAIDVESFTIKTRDGEEIRFVVDSDTKFRSHGVVVHSLRGMRLGMVTLVGGHTSGEGGYFAELVITINPASK